ncbi:hypothetical protein LT42_18620 [Pseudomonas lutea]|uniref:Uncharacterized protein n=1 Tax=Pseudomonas lutea TaxID=243924 RepID=A0A9X0JIN9_9PSED|nr:hypothetical protein LT42_18620 [Pseudomonas lutea]
MHGVLESSESAIGSDGLGLAIGAGAPKRSGSFSAWAKSGQAARPGLPCRRRCRQQQMASDKSPVTKDSVRGAL